MMEYRRNNLIYMILFCVMVNCNSNGKFRAQRQAGQDNCDGNAQNLNSNGQFRRNLGNSQSMPRPHANGQNLNNSNRQFRGNLNNSQSMPRPHANGQNLNNSNRQFRGNLNNS